MGIFSVNVVGMAMIQFAYFYPPAYGFEGLGDRVMWLLNFLFVDGKLRSLFSILFGASMMLVIEGAARAGSSRFKTHYARMIVLLLLGWLHWAVLWWGDILAHYAAVGMVAYWMWRLRAKTLLIISVVLFVLHAAPGYYFFNKEAAEYRQSLKPDAPADIKKKWEERFKELKPSAKELAEDRAEHENIATRFKGAMPGSRCQEWRYRRRSVRHPEPARPRPAVARDAGPDGARHGRLQIRLPDRSVGRPAI